MADALFAGPRLAELYDPLDPDRSDLDVYAAMARRHRPASAAGAGPVEVWTEVTEVSGSLVSFRTTFVFGRDGAVLTSDSTLRFRGRDELVNSVTEAGLAVDEVRGAPDRPGREFVFVTRRPAP